MADAYVTASGHIQFRCSLDYHDWSDVDMGDLEARMTDEELAELETAGKIVLGDHDWYPDGELMASALLEELRDGSFRVICYGCKRESWHVATPQEAYEDWLAYWKPSVDELQRLRAENAALQSEIDRVRRLYHAAKLGNAQGEYVQALASENIAWRALAKQLIADGGKVPDDLIRMVQDLLDS